MTNFNEAPDSGDIGAGDQSEIDQPTPSTLKGVGAKKGPKLARGRKKNPVSLSNKAVNKGPKGTKLPSGKKGGY